MRRFAPFLVLLGCPYTKPGSGTIVLEDGHNYGFTIDVELEAYVLQEYADHEGDWSSLATDMRGNAIESLDDIYYATLANFQGTLEELELAIENGTLTTNDFESPWEASVAPGVRTLHMSDFTLSGTTFDPADPVLGFQESTTSVWVWTLWRTNERLAADEIVSTAALIADDASSEVDFSFTPTSAQVVSFEADLTSGMSESVPGGLGPEQYTADWSAVTTDALGAPFDDLLATQLFIAHLGSATTPADVESTLLVDLNSAETWILGVYGVRTAALAQAYSTLTDSFFPGFTNDGVWVLGLMDPSGQQPAPYLMTVITVE